jgi:hypothetical protein
MCMMNRLFAVRVTLVVAWAIGAVGASAQNAGQPAASSAPAASPMPAVSPAPSASPVPARATPSPTPMPAADPRAAMRGSAYLPPKNRVYIDEDYDLRVAVPDDWYRANSTNYKVGGELLRVWTPGDETTIMLYRFVGKEPMLPLTLLDATADSMSSKRGAEILEQEVRKVSGKQAAWLVMAGDGNGGAIDGSGNIRTLQHMVAVPRAKDTVILMFVTSEMEFKKCHPAYLELLEKIKIGGWQNEAQQQSS